MHISELSDRFVKDPREVVKTGDVVKVRVKDVDVARKRIALTMKSGAIDLSAGVGSRSSGSAPMHPNGAPAPRQTSEPSTESALGAALRRAQEKNSG